ncbi:MAG TPA: ATP-binding protein, partial [Rhodocyclaceae bacterium]|nr:ATP-binding protein [Rhodocyclaceae bacterium]
KPLAAAGKSHLDRQASALPEGRVGRIQGGNDGEIEVFHAKIRRPVLAFDDPFYIASDHGEPADSVLGSVTLELSRASLEGRKREILAVSLIATLLVLGAGGLLAWRLGRDVTEPVVALQEAVELLRSGNLEARAPRHPSGTLASLETGVNEMAAALAEVQRRSATALATSEAELARQLRFAQAMLDALADAGVGLLVLEHGKIIFANRAIEQIFGYTSAELKALPSFIHLVHPDDRARVMYNHLRRVDGERFDNHYDFTFLRKTDGKGFADLAVATIPAGGHLQVLCAIVDVTDRKWAEARLAAAHQELLAKTEETVRASQGKSRFLAAASHDLRQPLHALTLFAAELEATAKSPEQRQFIAQINTAAGAMGELLDALLDVSRLDTAEVAPQRQPTALGPLLGSIADSHRQSARAKGLRFICRPTDLWANSDPHLLRRMVSNLVANAVRYTHWGGVLVGVRRCGERVRIEVWDTGVGIAAEHLPHLFQEFYQVDNPERDAAKGLGLGLSIVNRLSRILGHEVRVKSQPGRGTVFSVELPRASPQSETEQTPAAAPLDAQILVLSPGGEACEYLCGLLKAWYYRPNRVATADRLRQAMKKPTDLVIFEEPCAEMLAAALAKTGRIRPQLVLLGESSAKFPFPLDATLPMPVRPARLRALLHHLLHEGEEASITP